MSDNSKEYLRKYSITELIALGFGFPVAAGYVLILLNLPLAKVISVGIFSTVVAFLVSAFMGLPINALVSRRVRHLLAEHEAGRLTDRESLTDFFVRLSRLPVRYGILSAGRIVFGSLVTVVYMRSIGLSVAVCLMAVVLSTYGAYLSGVLGYIRVHNLDSAISREIVATGLLDEANIRARRIFGLSVRTKMVMFLVIPVFVTNLSFLFCVYTAAEANMPNGQMLLRLVGDFVVSIVTMLACIFSSMRMTVSPLDSLEKSLGIFSSGTGSFKERLPSDLSDEFSYIAFLMNKAICNFSEIIGKVHYASENLNNSIQELNVSTQEISATSNEQAAGVKEIIATMEDSDQLSKRVASQANEVARIAEGTKQVVSTGFGIIKESLEKMDSIKEANSLSIHGIKDLGDKIEKIWDIVNIINSIADQTKIIAFNAELEAASAGEAGKSFQIVATEIRRLADRTVASTSEIKNRINEMQNSSDHLILSSEEGTAKIIAGWELSNRLRTLFEDILKTSEISSDSAQQIAGSIEQQVVAFDQILVTLKQISSGIDNFVTSTGSTSRLTRVLMDMSVDLHQVVLKYSESDGKQA